MERIYRRRIATIVSLILLGIAVIVLSVFLGIVSHDHGKYKVSVENVYRHAYYALKENYMDIETNLEKVKVVKSGNYLEEVLETVSANANLAGLSLTTLNTSGNDLSSIYKFTNQVGDYTRYLLRKVEKGEAISEGERSTLGKMHAIARKIGEALSSAEEGINRDGYTFVDKLGKENDVFSMTIRELNNGSIEYPALIYDGPFSDGIHDIKPKNLVGEVITHEEGAKRIDDLFDEVVEATFASENTNKFTSFLYNVKMKDGSSGCVQLSEIGGHILMFTSFVETTDDVVSEEEARAIGTAFLSSEGYKSMQCVYASKARGCYYLNFAPKVDDVIYYPDLIKVKISTANGKVIGMESLNYIYNHTDRNINTLGLIGEANVIRDIPSELEIESVGLALIPKGVANEVLTYEIIGHLGEDKFYIYLDARTGNEVNVLMEIESNGGNLLI